jgi:LmbE family N-acetylglucosaminyl deacetylase
MPGILSASDRICVIAPHADDEILGAGGLLIAAQRAGIPSYVQFATVSGFSVLRGGTDSTLEQRTREVESVMNALAVTGYDVCFRGPEHHLRLDAVPQHTLLTWMESVSPCSLRRVRPTVVAIPSEKHNHQDHRALHDACIAMVRTDSATVDGSLAVLAYEIPGTGQTGLAAFKPTLYIRMDPIHVERKCELFTLYASQVSSGCQMRTAEAIRALARYRGMEAGYEFAEAYELLRWQGPAAE